MKTEALENAVDMAACVHGQDDLARAAQDELDVIKASDREARVADFHRACALPVASEPTVGTPEQRVLRVRLILEEVLEFAEAAGVQVIVGDSVDSMEVRRQDLMFYSINDPDLPKMLHELADTQYVTSGTAVELGLPLTAAFSEVHAANMRKVGPDGKAVMRNGKVCKPEGWQPADVAKVLAVKP